MSLETRYATLLRGGTDKSPLTSDGYKWPMGQAGAPLRHETYYLHYRKGGALFIPFDFAEVIQDLIPRLPNSREQGFLLANGYGMTPAMEAALGGTLTVYAQPKGSWANEQEPVVVPSGPSFLGSWVEPLAIAFHFPMQIATAIKGGQAAFKATCGDEGRIIQLVAEALGTAVEVEVCEEQYRRGLRKRLSALNRALKGDIRRAFEVGTRSMTCMAQMRIVLEECKAAGIYRTSNVKLAYDLYMTPVGTTGHEHQERHGADINGFRAIRDLRPEPPSYLFDTYDPIKLGIPAAIEAMLEDRTRRCSVRFDSGNQTKQLQMFVAAQKQYGLNLFYLFMDGYGDTATEHMEGVADELKVPRDDRHYGIGGFMVLDPVLSEYNRNRVAMVYKLCQTGGPGYDGVMGCRNVRKYSGNPNKASLGGRPIVVIDQLGHRYIAQQGENFLRDGGSWDMKAKGRPPRPTDASLLSPATLALNEACLTRDLGGRA